MQQQGWNSLDKIEIEIILFIPVWWKGKMWVRGGFWKGRNGLNLGNQAQRYATCLLRAVLRELDTGAGCVWSARGGHSGKKIGELGGGGN